MATISENLQTLATAKANIKSAIESKGQDLTNVPFTEYAGKISAIESGGSSVECDLVDVTQLSGNVQDDKIYRIAGQSGDYYVSFVGTAGGDTAQVTTLSDFLTMLGVSVSIKDEISVNGIDGVTEPILSDENGLFIYTDTSTYIGYVFGDFEGTGVVGKMTISDFVNMMNTLTGGNYPTLTDNGSKEDVSDITEDGVFYIGGKTIIGVPNANNNKNIMQYDGTEWKEVGVGGTTKQFEFRFPDGAALATQTFSYVYDEQYTIYSSDNHVNGRTWLFDKTTDERFEIFPYGGVAYFAQYGDFVCGGGRDRYYHSFIYNVKTKTLVKTYNYGYSNIQILYNGVLFSETGNGYQYYNFSTGNSLDEAFNLPVPATMFRVSDKKFITIYSGWIYVCDISNAKKETIALPSDIPANTNTKSHSVEMLDENMALVAGGTFVGILDVNTNEFIQYMSGSNMSPTCSQLQHIKRVGSYYLCVNYAYSDGKIIKIDFDNNEYSILMGGIQYPHVILTHTDWENAVVLANGKMFFFDSSNESITQISTNSSLTLDYFEQINEIDLLFITGSYAHCLNITDGSYTYKNVGNSRTVIKGTNKYLIVPTTQNGLGYIYTTSSDLSDFTQITTGVQVITTVKQKGDQYSIYTRNFDVKNLDTITEYVFSTGKDQLVMLTAKNVDEMFQ